MFMKQRIWSALWCGIPSLWFLYSRSGGFFSPCKFGYLNFNFKIFYCKVGLGTLGSWSPYLFNCKGWKILPRFLKAHKINLGRMKFAVFCSCFFQTTWYIETRQSFDCIIVTAILTYLTMLPLFLPVSSESGCEPAQGRCKRQITSPQPHNGLGK